jgi:predicted TPR repeat methyltransferase
MTDWRQVTVETYNKSAVQLAEYFQGYGSRVRDIDIAFREADAPDNPLVVEIGCGDGRDASELVKRTSRYFGFDLSKGMIDLARQNVPEGTFTVADAVTFGYPEGTDIVFAFASLLHLTKPEVKVVFEKVAQSLNTGGVFYISSKYSDTYKEKVKVDRHGKRMFYFYNPDILQEIAGQALKTVYIDHDSKGEQPWFQVALKKL